LGFFFVVENTTGVENDGVGKDAAFIFGTEEAHSAIPVYYYPLKSL
jgi:hypothetical protein